MSVITTHAPVVLEPASESPNRPTVIELVQEVAPLLFFVPVAGPPAILLVGPLVALALLLAAPVALLMTLVIVFLVGAGLLVALGALIASPYLLVRHLRARHALAHSEARISQAAVASRATAVPQRAAVAEHPLRASTSPMGA